MADKNTSKNTSKRHKTKQSVHLRPAKQWLKGKSGNPKGRPKGAKEGVRARLRRLLNKNAPDQAVEKLKELGFKFEAGDISEVLAAVLVTKAINKGDVHAIKEIFAQTEEPLTQTIKHEGEGIKIRVDASEIIKQYGKVLKKVLKK